MVSQGTGKAEACSHVWNMWIALLCDFRTLPLSCPPAVTSGSFLWGESWRTERSNGWSQCLCSGAFRICRVRVPCKVRSTPHIRLFSGKKSLRGRGLPGCVPFTHTYILSRGPRGQDESPSATRELVLKPPIWKRKTRQFLPWADEKARTAGFVMAAWCGDPGVEAWFPVCPEPQFPCLLSESRGCVKWPLSA